MNIVTKPRTCLTLLFVACALPAAGVAAPCAGTNINNTLAWSPTEVVKGTKISSLKITSVIVSDDPNAAFHLASGECVGSILDHADGTRSASGFCTRKDKDGDLLKEQWEASSGVGTSTLLGGTGKFANTTGSWKWKVIRLYGPTAAVRWSGDCR